MMLAVLGISVLFVCAAAAAALAFACFRRAPADSGGGVDSVIVVPSNEVPQCVSAAPSGGVYILGHIDTREKVEQPGFYVVCVDGAGAGARVRARAVHHITGTPGAVRAVAWIRRDPYVCVMLIGAAHLWIVVLAPSTKAVRYAARLDAPPSKTVPSTSEIRSVAYDGHARVYTAYYDGVVVAYDVRAFLACPAKRFYRMGSRARASWSGVERACVRIAHVCGTLVDVRIRVGTFAARADWMSSPSRPTICAAALGHPLRARGMLAILWEDDTWSSVALHADSASAQQHVAVVGVGARGGALYVCTTPVCLRGRRRCFGVPTVRAYDAAALRACTQLPAPTYVRAVRALRGCPVTAISVVAHRTMALASAPALHVHVHDMRTGCVLLDRTDAGFATVHCALRVWGAARTLLSWAAIASTRSEGHHLWFSTL